MKLTVGRSAFIATALFIFLIISTIFVSFLNIDRKTSLQGYFRYRNTLPLTVKESGFVANLTTIEDQEVNKGDTIFVMENRQLELDSKKSKNKIKIIRLELEDILKNKKYSSQLNFYDISRIDKELIYLKERKKIIEAQLLSKKELYKQKLVSKEDFEEKKLELNAVSSDLTKIAIQKQELEKRIDDLDQMGIIKYNLKTEELLNEELTLERLYKRVNDLTVVAPSSGKVIFKDYRDLENSYQEKGMKVGNVISFKKLDFYAMAKDGDIIRIKPGQKCYFNIEYLRGKEIVTGRVKSVGIYPIEQDNKFFFPVTIEADKKDFIINNKEYSLRAGITGDVIIITEEDVTIFGLLWEKFQKNMDIN